MEFLKSAVASAISKGPPFPYTFGERVDLDGSIWSLFNGIKREDGCNCSIFSFDAAANKSWLPLARNAVRKLRTLRHPGVVKVLDTVETENYIYIATERLTPLGWHVGRKSLNAETIKWGLYNTAKTLKFINEEASSVHGNIRVSSIFTSESGEWKLGGFEILSSLSEDDAILYSHGSFVPGIDLYAPPEIARSGWEAVKRFPLPSVDAYEFSALIYHVFNGSFSSKDKIGQTTNIPSSMHQSYRRLANSLPKSRLSVANFLEQGCKNGGFFQTNLINLTEGIENLGIKSEEQRGEFLRELDDLSDDFPEDYFKLRVLPELLKSIEFGGGGPKVFGVVMKIGSKLSEDEYNSQITPVVVRLFTSPDRAIRTVNDKIFPQMVTGFSDLSPVVREQTVKAVLTVIGKLSDRVVNGELLKYLAKTSNDDQPGIRTNTTICLGKIARNLGVNTRQKVLVAAFTRSLKDPFIHARNASLLALGATLDLFTDEDCANRILPALCTVLIDKEMLIRDQAYKTFELYVQRVRKYASSLPDTTLPTGNTPDPTNSSASRLNAAQNGSTWSGWAISSFTSKIASATGELQSSMTALASKEEGRPTSAPPAAVTQRLTASSTVTAPTEPRKIGRESLPASPEPSDSKFTTIATEGSEAWGAMNEGDSFFNETANTTSSKDSAANPWEDAGEPDFAGWLTAHAQAKSKGTLPKGLGKPAKSRSTSTKLASTGNIATISSSKIPPAGNAKLSLNPTSPLNKGDWGEADGWGDEWD
ncbi:MAG: hypothetical protein M1829_000875 [Trizodia sp. TS-e1964]|nr:MAG: hypothetical protein M1829_000875 [Trizodia sp. TS-e1964]